MWQAIQIHSFSNICSEPMVRKESESPVIKWEDNEQCLCYEVYILYISLWGGNMRKMCNASISCSINRNDKVLLENNFTDNMNFPWGKLNKRERIIILIL